MQNHHRRTIQINESNRMTFLRIFTGLYGTVFLLGLLVGKIYFSSYNNFSEQQELVKEKQSFSVPTTTNMNTKTKIRTKKKYTYDNYSNGTNNNEIGIVSMKDPSFFETYQEEIDALDDTTRCKRYGFSPPSAATATTGTRKKKRRRIFFGSLIASEPWEVFEIVATEAYGIYDGIVLVESNRTQNFHKREVTRAGNEHDRATTTSIIEELFGTTSAVNQQSKVQVRFWSDENEDIIDLDREHAQRQDILRGWKELGMKGDDIAIISDLDEVLTRDFLRAMQVCDDIDYFDYDKHNCRPDLMGIRSTTQVYEGSPECVTDDRIWFHPSIFPGSCLELIGDSNKHGLAPRTATFGERLDGWGHTWPTKWNESNPYTPLNNGGDFRDMGAMYSMHIHDIQAKREGEEEQQQNDNYKNQKAKKHYMEYTGFHFHNFFTRTDAIKFKYRTYGHPVLKAYKKKLEEIHEDLALMAYCARDERDPPDTSFKRVIGGFEALDPFTPIYFRDSDYRQRRHELIQQVVQLEDETWSKEKSNKKKKKKAHTINRKVK